MAHKTLISGTAYDITGGKTLVSGTSYSVKNGKALIGGTAYDISFLPPIGTALNDCTWEEIRAISDAGLASSYFSVGDRKAVILSGTVGSLSLSGTYYCYIIGIDHNSSVEGSAIHFQFGYTAASGGVHIAFVDSGYNSIKSSSSSYYFNMNSNYSNSGGWASSRMRNTIIPAFVACMPTALQNVLKPVTKYSDNTGGTSNKDSYVTATTDSVFLLSELEVFGTTNYANYAERNYQTQYAYYSAGNSKVKYQHSSTSSTAHWWLRSVHAGSSSNFCHVYTSGNTNYRDARYSIGFAPAFCV